MGHSDNDSPNGTSLLSRHQSRPAYLRESSGNRRFAPVNPLRPHASKEWNSMAGDTATMIWSTAYASGLAPSNDEAHDIAVDDSGNVYVTGTGTQLPTGSSYVTLKYSPAGQELWSARYSLAPDRSAIASAIALDDSGNIYVTGESEGGDGTWDYATVKYSASGVTLWAVRYGRIGGSEDAAQSIAVDPHGHVYVTGTSTTSERSDIVTIKYDPSGQEVWIAEFRDGQNLIMTGQCLALSDSGYLYVGGTTGSGPDSTQNFVVIKYDSSGRQLWATEYGGPAHQSDEAVALAIDQSGNAYVTGYSNDAGMRTNYATAKIRPEGIMAWAVRYKGSTNGADYVRAIAVNHQGRVYVTGQSDGPTYYSQFTTVMYDSAGVQQWVDRYSRYDGSSGGEGRCIEIVPDGNAIIAGVDYSGNQDYCTIEYDSTGRRRWIALYEGPKPGYDHPFALAVDRGGKTYVTGMSESGSGSVFHGNRDMATVKYAKSGVQEWVARFDGPGSSSDHPHTAAVDGEGNVIVIGSSWQKGSDDDFLCLKYDKSGTFQWVQRYDGPAHSIDQPSDLQLDENGNIYVSGRSDYAKYKNGYAVVKYTPEGLLKWVARYDAPGWNYQNCTKIDRNANVYVVGVTYSHDAGGINGRGDFTTIKFGPDGSQLWVAHYPASSTWPIEPVDILADESGHVYVTGWLDDACTTIKYDANGSLLWAARHPAPERGEFHSGQYLQVDMAGNVYVVGCSVGKETGKDILIIKYNFLGREQWAARYEESGYSYDWPYGCVVDADGNLYVTGWVSGEQSTQSIVTMRYSSSGVREWVTHAKSSVSASSITLDDSGDVIVSAGELGWDWWRASPPPSNGITVVYDKSGKETKSVFYPQAGEIIPGSNGEVAILGVHHGYITAVKYSSPPYGNKTPGGKVPESFSLSQNYPNPFNGSTALQYSLPAAAYTKVVVYNVLGQEIEVLVDEPLPAGTHRTEWHAAQSASGVYLVQMKAGPSTTVRKILLLR